MFVFGLSFSNLGFILNSSISRSLLTFTQIYEVRLRVNITIVYAHIVSATSAFSVCTLRVAFNVVLF